MAKNRDRDKWLRPEFFLSELLNKSIRKEFVDRDESPRVWFRALVLAVDTIGGKFENATGAGAFSQTLLGQKHDYTANVGPDNPRNSIKARIISDGYDQFISDDDLRVFWPMMPEHITIPIKPGEHAYVTFEDRDSEHGLWFGKVPGHSDVNFFEGQKSFKSLSFRRLTAMFGDSFENSTEEKTTDKVAGERLASSGKVKLFGDI